MHPVIIALFAITAAVVKQDGTFLREGCSINDTKVAELRAGDRARIRFALAGDDGACYKVVVASEGKEFEGYLAAAALDNLESFERARRGGRIVGGGGAQRSESAEDKQVHERVVAANGGGPLAKAVQLLQGGQFSEALQLTESYLKLDPKNPNALALAGYAAYQADDVKTAIDYWKRSLDEGADPAIEALLKKAENEAAADKSSQKLYSSRFLLRHEEAVPADTAREMVAVLESEYARISSYMGCSPDERIVTVVQSPEAYRRTTQASEWSGGQFSGRIHIALFEGKRIGAATRRVFAHELVHACLANLGRWPSWLHEGFAQTMSGESPSTVERQAVSMLAKQGKLPKLAEMDGSWAGMSADGAAVAYAMAAMAAELFEQHHSALGIRNLLRNPTMLPRVAEDLDRRLRGE